MNITEKIIEKLLTYYNVSTIKELAKKINIPESTISSWGQRNSINAIKKNCKRLGIYQEIFNIENAYFDITIEHKNINKTLALFNRRALVYLYFILEKKNISSAIEYFEWKTTEKDKNKLKTFFSNFYIDLFNDNLPFSAYEKELNRYIDLYLSIEELDLIFKNKKIFKKSILMIAEEKVR